MLGVAEFLRIGTNNLAKPQDWSLWGVYLHRYGMSSVDHPCVLPTLTGQLVVIEPQSNQGNNISQLRRNWTCSVVSANVVC